MRPVSAEIESLNTTLVSKQLMKRRFSEWLDAQADLYICIIVLTWHKQVYVIFYVSSYRCSMYGSALFAYMNFY